MFKEEEFTIGFWPGCQAPDLKEVPRCFTYFFLAISFRHFCHDDQGALLDRWHRHHLRLGKLPWKVCPPLVPGMYIFTSVNVENDCGEGNVTFEWPPHILPARGLWLHRTHWARAAWQPSPWVRGHHLDHPLVLDCSVNRWSPSLLALWSASRLSSPLPGECAWWSRWWWRMGCDIEISMTPIWNELQERGRWRGSGSHSAWGQVGCRKFFLSNFETIPGTGQATLPRHMGCTGRGLGTGTCVKTTQIKLKKYLYVPIFSFRAMILIDQDGLVAARQVRNCHLAHLGLWVSS